MSSIYKDGKYWKAQLDDGRVVHLGTPELIVRLLSHVRKCQKCLDCYGASLYMRHKKKL